MTARNHNDVFNEPATDERLRWEIITINVLLIELAKLLCCCVKDAVV